MLVRLFYFFEWKTSSDNPIIWYNQLSLECVTQITQLRLIYEAANSNTFIHGLLIMQNYLCKQHNTNWYTNAQFTLWSYKL